MNKEVMNAVATDAFAQAQEGFAVPLDPDLATPWARSWKRRCRLKCSGHFTLKRSRLPGGGRRGVVAHRV